MSQNNLVRNVIINDYKPIDLILDKYKSSLGYNLNKICRCRLRHFFKYLINFESKIIFPNKLKNGTNFFLIAKQLIKKIFCNTHINKKIIPENCKCKECTIYFDKKLLEIISSTNCTNFDCFINEIVQINRRINNLERVTTELQLETPISNSSSTLNSQSFIGYNPNTNQKIINNSPLELNQNINFSNSDNITRNLFNIQTFQNSITARGLINKRNSIIETSTSILESYSNISNLDSINAFKNYHNIVKTMADKEYQIQTLQNELNSLDFLKKQYKTIIDKIQSSKRIYNDVIQNNMYSLDDIDLTISNILQSSSSSSSSNESNDENSEESRNPSIDESSKGFNNN